MKDRKKKKSSVRAVGFGRNYFYALHKEEEEEGDKGHHPPPWKDTLPKSAVCTAQSTVVLTEKGKIYQTGTLHGQVYQGWTHIKIPLPLKCVEVSAGRHFCVARMEGGKAVLCWGAGHFSQLGTTMSSSKSSNSDDNEPVPTFLAEPVLVERLLPAHTGSPVKAVAAGDWHCLALTESGQVWSWGSNRSLQCGISLNNGKTTTTTQAASSSSHGTLSQPQPILSLPTIKAIAAGRSHSCALTASGGRVYCWGNSSHGQCGTGVTTRRTTAGLLPAPVEGLPSSLEMIQIEAGGHHCISISKAGRVFVWGDGREGQLGLSLTNSTAATIGTNLQQVQTSKPRLVADLDFVAVAAGQEKKQQTGGPSAAESLSAVPKIVAVYAAASYSAAISSSGHVYCWGSNDVGQLGLQPPRHLPVSNGDSDDDDAPDEKKDAAAANPESNVREMHVRLFDSNHNVLLPLRVQALNEIHVHKLAVGPNHMWCFGKDRVEGDDNNTVGKTLYEVQDAKRGKRLEEAAALRNNTLCEIKAKAQKRLEEEKAELGLDSSRDESLNTSVLENLNSSVSESILDSTETNGGDDAVEAADDDTPATAASTLVPEAAVSSANNDTETIATEEEAVDPSTSSSSSSSSLTNPDPCHPQTLTVSSELSETILEHQEAIADQLLSANNNGGKKKRVGFIRRLSRGLLGRRRSSKSATSLVGSNHSEEKDEGTTANGNVNQGAKR